MTWRKGRKEPSFEEKWKREAPKARKWADKNFLTVLRADFAQIENEVLSRNDFSIRADHRTLKSQKEEAEQNGDTFLARLFSRVPEKYIGMYKTQEFASKYLLTMKNKMLTAVAEVNKWKRVIISQHNAEEQARLEYMNKAEKELWQRYFETLAQKKQLEEFLKTLKKPDESDKEATRACEDVISGIKSKIYTLFIASLKMKKSVEEMQQRLDSPEFKNNITLVTHQIQILQANTYARKMLKRASGEPDKAVDDLRNELFAKTLEEPQSSFRTREVYDLIRQRYRALKKEYTCAKM